MYQVVLPYFKSKLHAIYNREREARLQATLWGDSGERYDDADIVDRGDGSGVSRGSFDAEASVRTRLAKKIQKLIGACYPWVHASSEGMHLLAGHLLATQKLFIFVLNISSSKYDDMQEYLT